MENWLPLLVSRWSRWVKPVKPTKLSAANGAATFGASGVCTGREKLLAPRGTNGGGNGSWWKLSISVPSIAPPGAGVLANAVTSTVLMEVTTPVIGSAVYFTWFARCAKTELVANMRTSNIVILEV